jgi:hypothetical protein
VVGVQSRGVSMRIHSYILPGGTKRALQRIAQEFLTGI